MKTTFPKTNPRLIDYRDYALRNLRTALQTQNSTIDTYAKFEVEFMETLNDPAPLKKKTLRANDKSFMTKALRRAIMKKPALQNRYCRGRLPESLRAFKKQRNFTNRLLKKEKRKYNWRTST